jgi:hypothetical protein
MTGIVTNRSDPGVFYLLDRFLTEVCNPMRYMRLTTIFGSALLAASALGAQTPANDPSERLREVLPAEVADKVLATIADARLHNLPTQALEQRALKFAAKGVDPALIPGAIGQQKARMQKAKDALDDARGRRIADEEIEAGAEALRQGVDGAQVSELAKSAPSGRSLAVPLFVIGSLVDRGLPSDDALAQVLARLQARATDADLEKIPEGLGASHGNRPATAGRPANPGKALGTSGARGGGPPAGVPANSGKKPATPPGKGKN